MFDWLRLLRRNSVSPRRRECRRTAALTQAALVQVLEPREMLTRLDSSEMVSNGVFWDYRYQSGSVYHHQYVDDYGSHNDTYDPTDPDDANGETLPFFVHAPSVQLFHDTTEDHSVIARATLTVSPTINERIGDAAYLYIEGSGSSFSNSTGQEGIWNHAITVGSSHLVISNSSPPLESGGRSEHMLAKIHIGDTFQFNSTLFATYGEPNENGERPSGSVGGSVLVHSFTANAVVSRINWEKNSDGSIFLDGTVDGSLSGFSPSSEEYPFDFASGSDNLFAHTKVRLVWSSTPNPNGALGTAYEYEMGEPDDPIFDYKSHEFHINVNQLADAPAGTKYLVMVVDPNNTLWESHEEDNYYAIDPITAITSVKANYDDEQADDVFGIYLAGVPLETTFTVKTLDPSSVGKSLRYTITKENGDQVEQKTVAVSSTPGQYEIKYDMGKLPKGTLKLKLELLNGSNQALTDAVFEGQLLVTDQLEIDFKGAGDGKPMKFLDKLRFIEEIGVVTDFEASITKLPLFDQYKNKFDFVLRDSNSKAEVLRKPVTFQNSSGFVSATVEDWNSKDQIHDLREGAEYEAVLSARDKTTTTFDSAPLNVERLPKWLTGTIDEKPNKFENGQFQIHASFPPGLADISISPDLFPVPKGTYGLFEGAKTELSAGLQFDVVAGLSIDEEVTAKPTGLETKVTLLGQELIEKRLWENMSAATVTLTNETKLTNPDAVTFSTGVIKFSENVNLFNVAIGKTTTKDISITRQILSKLAALNGSGVIDLSLDASAKLDEFTGNGTFTISGLTSDDPQFVREKSTFVVTAKATAEVNASAGASLSVIGYTLASAAVNGKVWVKVEGQTAVSFGGSVLHPSLSTLAWVPEKTGLAAQFGAELFVSAKIAGHPEVSSEPLTAKSKVYTLFGNNKAKITLTDPEASETVGDGIVKTSTESRSADLVSATAVVAQATANVSTMTFKAPLDSNATRIQLNYDITSTIKPLAAGRHRFEVVAIPLDTTVAETVLTTVDLATLPLSGTPQAGYQSTAQSLVVNLTPGQLNPQLNQHLVLRLTSDPASGETVRVRPSTINVTVAEPTLSLTAPSGILNDGAIIFGTETSGATKVDLQLANTGSPMLLVDDLRVEGSNLRLSSTGHVDLYSNDLSTPLTVEVIDPALPVSGFVKFTTNDPTRPEISIPVSYTPPNTAPTISGLPANQAVNDAATISPFSAVTVNDPNQQNMLAKVTILNGTVRGDFTTASVTGWTRSVSGNNIVYSRFYNPQANIGSVIQAALRGFVFVPRANAIKPNTTELTDIQVFVNDGVANTTATTRLTTTSVNNAPLFGGTTANVSVNDNATINPFTTLSVSDVDNQEMLISVTILNGTVRGDFTAASTAGWAVRYVLGNNITYKRYFSPQAHVGAAAQAAFRALVFQPRQNAIKPGTTEATDFQVTVSDGVAPAVLGTGTRLTTTSVNNTPTISGAVANQAINDNQTKAVFSALTVTDPDTQDLFVRITINGGTTKGDLTAASSAGWTRKISGTNILYERFFAAATNNAAVVQTAIRALIFKPRTDVPVGTSETTSLTVFVNDGLANVTNNTTSVITTGVASRATGNVLVIPGDILNRDITTIVIPSAKRPTANPLTRLLRKSR